MSEDKVAKNPTLLETKIETDMKCSEKSIREATKLVETFLLEFCEVNGISENELKNHLAVRTSPADLSILVINADDERDVKFGVKIITDEGNETYDIFGEYTDMRENYPKTTKTILK